MRKLAITAALGAASLVALAVPASAQTYSGITLSFGSGGYGGYDYYDQGYDPGGYDAYGDPWFDPSYAYDPVGPGGYYAYSDPWFGRDYSYDPEYAWRAHEYQEQVEHWRHERQERHHW